MVAKHKKNEERITLEPILAASLLYYDKEEFDTFLEYWNDILNVQEVEPTPFMIFFVDSLKKVFKEQESSYQPNKSEAISKIKNLNELNPSAIGREQFLIWLDNVEQTDAPEDFELASELFYRYLWSCYKDLVSVVDKSEIPFKEKLTLRPIKANMSDSSKPIIKISEIEKNDRNLSVYSTGINFLDEKVQPKDSNFMVVAARPSVGKSVFILQQALHNASNGIPCLFISLEMTSEQIENRIFCWYKKRLVTEDEYESIKQEEGFQTLNNNFMLMANKSNNTNVVMDYIASAIEEYGVKIVFIDYLQLLRYPNMDEWASLRKLTHDLKQFAVQNNVLMVSCSQVSRSSKDYGLELTDLFGSSSIESDTDIVIGLETTGRDVVDDSDNRILHLSILKNRQGLKDKKFKTIVRYIPMIFTDMD